MKNYLILIAMHFVLACNVYAGASGRDLGPVIDEIEVRSGWKELTDEATVTLPKKLVDFGLIDVNVGDPIRIDCGYIFPNYDATQNTVVNSRHIKTVFNGYISRVNPKIPMELMCEDASWLCKQVNINKAWNESVTFKEIIDYTINEVNAANPDYPNIGYDSEALPEITFESFRIPNKNAAQVLQTFKDNPYNLAIYFDDHELNIHLAYGKSFGNVEYFLAPGDDGDQNVIDHDLQYRDVGDHKVQIKAVIVKSDNTFTENTYGEPGGDTFTLTFNQDQSPDIVKRLSEEKLKRFAEGYRGRLQTFMLPYARHSMTARVVDPEFSRDDKYHIDATTLRFGDGITIDVEIGIKV